MGVGSECGFGVFWVWIGVGLMGWIWIGYGSGVFTFGIRFRWICDGLALSSGRVWDWA